MTADIRTMVFDMEDAITSAEGFATALADMGSSTNQIEPHGVAAVADELVKRLASLREQWQELWNASKGEPKEPDPEPDAEEDGNVIRPDFAPDGAS